MKSFYKLFPVLRDPFWYLEIIAVGSRDPLLWKHLYVSLIRTHLEYTAQAWNLNLIGGIEKLEVTKTVAKIFEHFGYLDFASQT